MLKMCKISSDEFDKMISNFTDESKSGKNIPAVQIYHSTTRLLLVWDKPKDKERIEKICRHDETHTSKHN